MAYVGIDEASPVKRVDREAAGGGTLMWTWRISDESSCISGRIVGR
jgi:hypothetical protein